MLRMVITVLVYLLANAIGLIVAAVVLDDMTINSSGFLLALVIFTVIEVVIQPLIVQTSIRHTRALSGSSALLASFIGLVLTAWISDGIQISGTATWLFATVTVWAAALLAAFILPAFVFKRLLKTAPTR